MPFDKSEYWARRNAGKRGQTEKRDILVYRNKGTIRKVNNERGGGARYRREAKP